MGANRASPQQSVRSTSSVANILEQLPRIAHSAELFSGNPHPTTCPICMENWTDVSSDIVLTPCLHAFHEKCLQGWMVRSIDCPSCRWDISKSGDQGRPASAHDLVERPMLRDLAGSVVTIDDDSE